MNSEQEKNKLIEVLKKEGHIKSKKVENAFRKVDRRLFISPKYSDDAYADHPLPIGCSQTVSAPHMVAIMSELADIRDSDEILEIGTGSGYQAAILAELAKTGHVTTVERHKELFENASNLIERLGYGNITCRCGDGTLGYGENAPYDRIIVTAASPRIPKQLISQLGKNSKLLIPVGDRIRQTLVEVFKKEDEKIEIHEHGGCVFVPLIGADGWDI
ncbi:MAG: protein-L-isoaspartate(D-aspartate) O-methyltransferase [Candidatus Altiarchaeota archaeon]|nr:protein-L-isoaspartate(D-aspartate) O-methyltransferase [Candidatus Altiarchaeota archaeon]